VVGPEIIGDFDGTVLSAMADPLENQFPKDDANLVGGLTERSSHFFIRGVQHAATAVGMQAQPHVQLEGGIGEECQGVGHFAAGGEPSGGAFEAKPGFHCSTSSPGLRRFLRRLSPFNSIR
jgi:hypothetical protein